MKLIDYIKGARKGKDAHRIELDAMSDPFLRDALEGFDSVDGDHGAAIERMQEMVRARSMQQKPRRRVVVWSAAAGVLLLLTVGGILFTLNDGAEKHQLAVESVQNEVEDSTKIIAMSESETNAAKETSGPVVIEAIKFCPPVVNMDVADEDCMKTQDEVVQSKAIVYTQDIEGSKNDEAVVDAIVTGYASAKRATSASGSVSNVVDKAPVSSPQGDISPREVQKSAKENNADLMVIAADKSESKISASQRAESAKMREKPIESEQVASPYSEKHAFNSYVSQNIASIKNASGEKITGEVVVRFDVNSEGAAVKTSVVKSLSKEADAEALRLVKKFKWTISGEKREVTVVFK